MGEAVRIPGPSKELSTGHGAVLPALPETRRPPKRATLCTSLSTETWFWSRA